MGSLEFFPHFSDTRESPLLIGGLVFGRPFLLHCRSGHFPAALTRKVVTPLGILDTYY